MDEGTQAHFLCHAVVIAWLQSCLLPVQAAVKGDRCLTVCDILWIPLLLEGGLPSAISENKDVGCWGLF